MKRVRNIGHRGAAGYAPENTMAAFYLAMKMGCDGLEFDVQLTKDGVPVVIHDEQLIRTTGVAGMVVDYTWEMLQHLDAGLWRGTEWRGERIPSLEEVLTTFSHAFLNIELKNTLYLYEGLEQKVIDLVNHYCSPEQVIVSSFNPMSVQKMMNLAPHIPAGFLVSEPTSELLKIVLHSNAQAIHPDFQTLSTKDIQMYQQQGLDVNTWTVNEQKDMQRMRQLGVTSIITDFPDRLTALLHE